MTCGALFAAILAVLAAAEEPKVDEPSADAPEADVPEQDGAPERGALAAAALVEGLPLAPVAPPVGRLLSESGPILLDRVERAGGWATERVLEPNGEIVEHDVNRAGTVHVCREVGSIFTLRVIEQRPTPTGEVIHVVRDASGALLRYAVNADGEPRAVALLAPPPR